MTRMPRGVWQILAFLRVSVQKYLFLESIGCRVETNFLNVFYLGSKCNRVYNNYQIRFELEGLYGYTYTFLS